MKKNSLVGLWIIGIIISIPIIYAASIYQSLPEIIPVHFDIKGNPDGYGNKTMLWTGVLLIAAITSGVYFLLVNLPKIDPKKTAGQSPELLHKIAVTLVVFLSALNLVIIYSSVNGSINFSKMMLPLMGLFFMVLGNYLYSIKPNYFLGFRLPWTLENEDNWRKTHQLVGKLWVPGGLLITIGTLLLPPEAGFLFFFTFILIITIIPGVFSYRYFKKTRNLN